MIKYDEKFIVNKQKKTFIFYLSQDFWSSSLVSWVQTFSIKAAALKI